MLVVIAERQILSPQQICQGCLMSDKQGLPRWRNSRLACGKIKPQSTGQQAKIYQCQMGFKVTWIN